MKINEFIVEGTKKKVEVSTKKPIGYEISDVGKGGVEKNKRSDAEWKKQKTNEDTAPTTDRMGELEAALHDSTENGLVHWDTYSKITTAKKEHMIARNRKLLGDEDLEEGVFGNMAAAAKGALGTKGQGGIMKTVGKAVGNAKNAWTNSANTAGMKTAQKAQAKKVEAATQKAMNSWAQAVALVPQGQQPSQGTLNSWWTTQFGTNAPRVKATDNVAVSGAVRKAVQTKMAAGGSAPIQGGQPGATQSQQPVQQPTAQSSQQQPAYALLLPLFYTQVPILLSNSCRHPKEIF